MRVGGENRPFEVCGFGFRLGVLAGQIVVPTANIIKANSLLQLVLRVVVPRQHGSVRPLCNCTGEVCVHFGLC